MPRTIVDLASCLMAGATRYAPVKVTTVYAYGMHGSGVAFGSPYVGESRGTRPISLPLRPDNFGYREKFEAIARDIYGAVEAIAPATA